MKKMYKSYWMKLAVALVWSAAIVAMFLGFINLYVTQTYTKQQIMEEARETIAGNMAAEILAQVQDGVFGKDEFTIEIVEQNYSIAIVQADHITDEQLKEDSAYLYRTPDFTNVIDNYQYAYWRNENTCSSWIFENSVIWMSTDHAWFEHSRTGEQEYYLLMKQSELKKDTLNGRLTRMVDTLYEWKRIYPVVIIVGIFLFFFLGAYLLRSAGHKAGHEGICLGKLDKIPFEILTAGGILIEICFVSVGVGALENEFPVSDMLFILLEVSMLTLCCLTIVPYAMSIATRFKARKFLRYTVLYYVYKPFQKVWRWLRRVFKALYFEAREHLGLMAKVMLGVVALTLLEGLGFLISLGIADFFYSDVFALFFSFGMILWMLQSTVGVLAVLQFKRLQEGGERIASGDFSQPIDTQGLLWEFKKHGENINKVGDGIQAAVQERLKSEHFKTELITNVSHDIKTPLTSIINYVDLIKKEDITDETLQSYVDVLDRQSARLKKLIEDLMEASKASTGNLEVNLEHCDVGVLITQMVGEFEERAQQSSLQFIVQTPEQPIVILADGRHLWRVFDNLLVNVCKYALPGTRVYVDLRANVDSRMDSDAAPEGGIRKASVPEAVITFKNISKNQLNISSEELMERFVRGDSSRNTEGSGLGLSIAQSLTELMNGKMRLEVDGDLFKVILQFPIVQGKEC